MLDKQINAYLILPDKIFLCVRGLIGVKIVVHIRASGIQPEIVDLLQGRVSSSILTRHYLVPAPSFKEDILQALEQLQRQL